MSTIWASVSEPGAGIGRWTVPSTEPAPTPYSIPTSSNQDDVTIHWLKLVSVATSGSSLKNIGASCGCAMIGPPNVVTCGGGGERSESPQATNKLKHTTIPPTRMKVPPAKTA